jgi:hypothetical protein
MMYAMAVIERRFKFSYEDKRYGCRSLPEMPCRHDGLFDGMVVS